MERKEVLAVTRHFFKVLIPGFHHKLKLPPALTMELEREKSRRATLHSCLGTWIITISKNCETNLMCFDEGWSEFVESHALHVGDFLVFEHTKNLHFNVLVFDSTTCEKEFHIEPKTKTKTKTKTKKKKKKKKKKKERNEEALIPTSSSHPKKRMREESEEEDRKSCFVKTMKPSFATKVSIPMEFTRRNGVGVGKKTRVSLRDPNGKEWLVNVSNYERNGVRLIMFGKIWHNFCKSNLIKVGDTCLFKLRRRSLSPTSLFFDVQIN